MESVYRERVGEHNYQYVQKIFLFMAASVAYGSSQASGQIRAIVASLHNMGSLTL